MKCISIEGFERYTIDDKDVYGKTGKKLKPYIRKDGKRQYKLYSDSGVGKTFTFEQLSVNDTKSLNDKIEIQHTTIREVIEILKLLIDLFPLGHDYIIWSKFGVSEEDQKRILEFFLEYKDVRKAPSPIVL